MNIDLPTYRENNFICKTNSGANMPQGATERFVSSPEEVYDAVTALVAQHLAEEGLELPAFEACLAACGSFPPSAP